MKEFIEFIAKNLVDAPNSVNVDETNEEGKVVLKLYVAKDDLGKVIGRKGRTAKSIRTLLTAVAAKHNKSAYMEISENTK